MTRVYRLIGSLFTLLFATLLLSVITTSSSSALSSSDFQAGRIVDDSVFYNDNSMTVAQIQAFLDAKVPDCDTNGSEGPYYDKNGTYWTTRGAYGAASGYPGPYTCLKNYSQNVPTVTNGGSDLCQNSISSGTKSSAQIIYDVSHACGINPQTLLVMLQKEQSLITDEWPWPSQYDKAMGYACPDSGPNNSANCNSEYFGFFNQVYNAAKAFRRYESNPDSYNYKAGRNNFVYYHPSLGACGGSNVFIENQATASLYIYTPYQPNQAALNNLYGTGNSCSAYGNRNFWRMFNDWFGSTNISGFTLIECDGNKYLHENGEARIRLITDFAYEAWNFDKLPFIQNSYLCDYSVFDIELDMFVRSRNSNKAYLVDNSTAYFLNPDNAAAWGIESVNSALLPKVNSSNILYFLETSLSTSQVVTSTNSSVSKRYVINDGKRYEIDNTDIGDYSNLDLIIGYNEVAVNMLSVDLLQKVPAQIEEIGFAVEIAGRRYFTNHNSLLKIAIDDETLWERTSFVELKPEFLALFSNTIILRDELRRNSTYYYFEDSTSTIYESNSARVVENIKNQTSESVYTTILLRDKLFSLFANRQTENELVANIRLVECDGEKHIIERFRKVLRDTETYALDNWKIDDFYFFKNDRGCSYPTYTLSVDDVIRSRTSNKVYFVENGRAILINSQADADDYSLGDIQTVLSTTHPNFDGDSINYLTIIK